MALEIVRKRIGGIWRTVPVQENENGGSGPLLVASKTLTSADLLALDTTLVELLPAPGGRKYYVPFSVVLHYRFGTVAYDGGAENLLIGYGPATLTPSQLTANQVLFPCYTASSVWGPFQPPDLLAQTEDAYAFHSHAVIFSGESTWDQPTWLAASIEDQPLCIASLNTFTLGDGELTLRLFYSLRDGAS